jgi:hypothetical protein
MLYEIIRTQNYVYCILQTGVEKVFRRAFQDQYNCVDGQNILKKHIFKIQDTDK